MWLWTMCVGNFMIAPFSILKEQCSSQERMSVSYKVESSDVVLESVSCSMWIFVLLIEIFTVFEFAQWFCA